MSLLGGEFLNALIKALDCLTECVGRFISFGILLMMLVTCLVVILRYVFQSGNIIVFQETTSYLHSVTFLLAAGWTLKRNGHVRVDIFYRRMSPRTQAWVDSLGILIFLLPFATFLMMTSYEFVARSWSIRESSADAGGIPYVYLLKTLIPAMCALLIIQGVAELLRNGLRICTTPDPVNATGEEQ